MEGQVTGSRHTACWISKITFLPTPVLSRHRNFSGGMGSVNPDCGEMYVAVIMFVVLLRTYSEEMEMGRRMLLIGS
jgi:hypothetical protein